MTPADENKDLILYRLDELHRDVREIKAQTTATNGRVNQHDVELARLKGAIGVLIFLVPLVGVFLHSF